MWIRQKAVQYGFQPGKTWGCSVIGLEDGVPASMSAFPVRKDRKLLLFVYVSKAEYDGWMAMPEGQNANFDMDKPVATASRIMILDYARENGLTMAGMI